MIRIPKTFIDVFIWMVITYYGVGYDPSVERFFKQFVLLLCISQMANGLFRLIGGIGRNATIANTFAFGALLFIIGLGGFILPRGKSLAKSNLTIIALLCVIVEDLINFLWCEKRALKSCLWGIAWYDLFCWLMDLLNYGVQLKTGFKEHIYVWRIVLFF